MLVETLTPVQAMPKEALDVYALTTAFNERTADLSSIDALRQDPAYQAVVGLGQEGIVRILDRTRLKGASWIVLALDEMAGENVTGIGNPALPSKGITLDEVHERAQAWGERNNYVGIRDEAERLEKAGEVFDLVKTAVILNPTVTDELAEGFFTFSGNNPEYKFIDNLQLTLDGEPMEAGYVFHNARIPTYHTREIITLTRGPKKSPGQRLSVSVFRDASGKVIHGSFRGFEGIHNTWESYASIKDTFTRPLEIKPDSLKTSEYERFERGF